MASVKELIRVESDQTLSFGDYELQTKTKKADFEFNGDIYKIKTFFEMTKLEKNGAFLYESVPGTAVTGFKAEENGVVFTVESKEDTQITLELEEDTVYTVKIDNADAGEMKTNSGGKITVSVETQDHPVMVEIRK